MKSASSRSEERRVGKECGDVWDWTDKHENSRALTLKVSTSFQLESGIKMWLNGIEYLCLDELKKVTFVENVTRLWS